MTFKTITSFSKLARKFVSASVTTCHTCVRCSPVSAWATTCECSTSCGELKEWSTSSQIYGRVKCVTPNCWRACRVSAGFIGLDVCRPNSLRDLAFLADRWDECCVFAQSSPVCCTNVTFSLPRWFTSSIRCSITSHLRCVPLYVWRPVSPSSIWAGSFIVSCLFRSRCWSALVMSCGIRSSWLRIWITL